MSCVYKVERALGFWQYGTRPLDDQKLAFSGDNYAERTAVFVNQAASMSPLQWKKVMDGGFEFIPKYAKNRSRSPSPALVSENGGVKVFNMATRDEDSDLEPAD